MGLIQNIIQNFKQKEQEMEDIDDNETKDRYLRTLRRERRVQLEAEEKEHLKQIIAEYRKQKLKEHLYGIKGEMDKEKANIIKRKINERKVNILKQRNDLIAKHSLLNNRKDEFKKTKTSKATFLNKSNLI